jgi:hypothetical protein
VDNESGTVKGERNGWKSHSTGRMLQMWDWRYYEGYDKLERGEAGKKDDKGLMTEWTNFVGALHGAAAAFLVDT